MRKTALLLIVLFLAACSTPITAKDVGPDRVYRHINESVLTTGEPSNASTLVLHRTGLTDAYDSDPRAALGELHRKAVLIDRRDRLFALAELSLVAALDSGDRDLSVAAAVYAYLYLLGDAEKPQPTGFDRRFRVACDIYNRALGEAFRDKDGRWVPEEGTFQLPFGSITIDLPEAKLHIGTQSFDEFRPAFDYEVQGLTGWLHQSGLGVPLIAGAPRRKTSEPHEMSPGALTAASGFLEVLGELDAASGGLRGVLTLHSAKTSGQMLARGRTIPLELDATTPLAYSLKESKLWDFELGSFLSPDKTEIENGLQLLSPYEPGRIPVVFVHGTASSPARWGEMINEIAQDPVVRENCSAWLFIYKTSAPILLSAKSLRDSLRERIQAIDPDGVDAALQHMVVIGHSQGGLLTRLMVTESGDNFWRSVSDRPFDELAIDDEEKEALRSAFFFEPVPQVERVVFISTPHRGSFLSDGLIRTIVNGLISIPQRTMQVTQDVVTKNVDFFKPDVIGKTPSAMNNMSPGDGFLIALGESPVSDRVHAHSIVAVTDLTPPLEDQDDGVVEYTSAHVGFVESELVVESGHSAQDNPFAILEVRRILREHVKAYKGARKAEPETR